MSPRTAPTSPPGPIRDIRRPLEFARPDEVEAVLEGMGRRERKKMQTRLALSKAALRLFLERGFDSVTVAEIAEEADTAVTTLFKHFPSGKESLILDDGAEREASVTAAVRGRATGQSIVGALHEFFSERGVFAPHPSPLFVRQLELVASTPALRAYARRIWTGCETALTEAMAAELGRDANDLELRILARYVLEAPDLAGAQEVPGQALDLLFDHLERGWPGV